MIQYILEDSWNNYKNNGVVAKPLFGISSIGKLTIANISLKHIMHVLFYITPFKHIKQCWELYSLDIMSTESFLVSLEVSKQLDRAAQIRRKCYFFCEKS